MEKDRYFQDFKKRAWVEVDRSAIFCNIREIISFLGKERSLLAVVKANAYGHGMLDVAKTALEAGAEWLGVATVSEGIELRSEGVSDPIVLLCAPTPDDAAEILHHQLTPAIGDFTLLRALGEVASRFPLMLEPEVHLEIDTGCGRSGFLPKDALEAWREAVQSGLKVTGLATHFADADGSEEAFTWNQWKQFAETRAALEEAGAKFDWFHAGNSAATLRLQTLECNLVRPGLLIYGISPPLPFSLQSCPKILPALSLRARVASVRDLPEGHNISYGLTHALLRPSKVATVLIGYGDGYPRRLSNCGEMLLHGKRVPILGRVCMDQTVVDVTDLPEIRAGDIATCIGADGAERIRIEEIAKLIHTTDHEITSALTARVGRGDKRGEYVLT